ncbi:adenosine 3', partial [Dinothrombium tinctorium]
MIDSEYSKKNFDTFTPNTKMHKSLLLIFCFVGLQSSYLWWGVLQEKIMTTEYTISLFRPTLLNNSSHIESGDQIARKIHFRDSQFLVLVNRILAFIFALVAIILSAKLFKKPNYSPLTRSKVYSIAPLYEFVFCSLSNILSSWCQYEALKFVNFPTQVLSKACKILPVMLMSQVVSGKKHATLDYIFAISISTGMCLFLFSNPKNVKNNDVEEMSYYKLFDGLLVLALYLTFDSFTSNWQGKLFEKYKISTLQMMAAVNFYSIMLTFTSLTEQGDLIPALKIIFSSSQLTKDCIMLSICSAIGQLFVFFTISTFGAIVFVTIMTLRQALAILLSCIIYGHSLTTVACIGISIVFITLFVQTYMKCKKS